DAAIRAAYAEVTPAAKRAVLRWYRAADPKRYEGWDDRLQAIIRDRAPAIVVWGEHDPYIEGHFADRFGAKEVHRFKDAGHWVIAEEAEAVAEKFAAFFTAGSS